MLLTDPASMEVPPRRIISLVPSQTELLHYLGLEAEVIGITKFCIHPDSWFRSKTRIGGTKTLNLDLIRKLQPDLIIANKEENTKEQVENLAVQFPVWVSDVNTLEEALTMIIDIGQLTKKSKAAQDLAHKISSAFSKIQQAQKYSAAYLIWNDPLMVAGGDTFISDMMERAGFVNVFKGRLRYPAITVEELIESKPAQVLLSSEPFPFKEKHIDELKAEFLEKTSQLPQFRLVDGEMFSWYGSRLLDSAEYLKTIISG